jgi:hypothetical protein
MAWCGRTCPLHLTICIDVNRSLLIVWGKQRCHAIAKTVTVIPFAMIWLNLVDALVMVIWPQQIDGCLFPWFGFVNWAVLWSLIWLCKMVVYGRREKTAAPLPLSVLFIFILILMRWKRKQRGKDTMIRRRRPFCSAAKLCNNESLIYKWLGEQLEIVTCCSHSEGVNILPRGKAKTERWNHKMLSKDS